MKLIFEDYDLIICFHYFLGSFRPWPVFFSHLFPIFMPEASNNNEVRVKIRKNHFILCQVVKPFLLPKLHRMCLQLDYEFNKTKHIDCQREDFLFPN